MLLLKLELELPNLDQKTPIRSENGSENQSLVNKSQPFLKT